MAASSILAGISQEVTQQELLAHMTILLAAMLEKMPRTDANDRLVTNNAETTQPVSISTLATVTTVGTVTTMSNQTNIGGRDASNVAYALANMGTAHIYNQIQVS